MSSKETAEDLYKRAIEDKGKKCTYANLVAYAFDAKDEALVTYLAKQNLFANQEKFASKENVLKLLDSHLKTQHSQEKAPPTTWVERVGSTQHQTKAQEIIKK